jgi:hypothetical protein
MTENFDVRRSLKHAALLLALEGLALAGMSAAHAADKAPRHVTKPVSTITVKVVGAEDYQRKAKGADPTRTADGRPAQWILTTLDADSCVAWVSKAAKPNVATVQLDAFVACQVAIGRAGKGGAK